MAQILDTMNSLTNNVLYWKRIARGVGGIIFGLIAIVFGIFNIQSGYVGWAAIAGGILFIILFSFYLKGSKNFQATINKEMDYESNIRTSGFS